MARERWAVLKIVVHECGMVFCTYLPCTEHGTLEIRDVGSLHVCKCADCDPERGNPENPENPTSSADAKCKGLDQQGRSQHAWMLRSATAWCPGWTLASLGETRTQSHDNCGGLIRRELSSGCGRAQDFTAPSWKGAGASQAPAPERRHFIMADFLQNRIRPPRFWHPASVRQLDDTRLADRRQHAGTTTEIRLPAGDVEGQAGTPDRVCRVPGYHRRPWRLAGDDAAG